MASYNLPTNMQPGDPEHVDHHKDLAESVNDIGTRLDILEMPAPVQIGGYSVTAGTTPPANPIPAQLHILTEI